MAYTREMKLNPSDKRKYLLRLYKKLRVNEETGCFEWTGCARNGYGKMGFQGRVTGPHRVMLGCIYGTIPTCLEVDHLCRNRLCFHPDHLELVKHRENLERSPDHSIHKGASSVCIRGHAKEPHIPCKQCNRENFSLWRAKNKERMNEISRASYAKHREEISARRKARQLTERSFN